MTSIFVRLYLKFALSTNSILALNWPSLLACTLVFGCNFAANAQQIQQGVAIVSEDIASRVDGFSFRPDSSSTLGFRGTALASRAEGTAKIRTTEDRTEISGKFEHLAPPSSYGPFAVYVIWVVTPEGRAMNAGMLEMEGEKARVNGTTPLSSFALIVTAEPHFAVTVPSKYVVLQNFGQELQGTQLVITSLAARADYSALKSIKDDAKQRIPAEMIMARYAMAIADQAGGAQWAPGSFDRAQRSLIDAQAAMTAKQNSVRARVPELARESIQAAEDARAAAASRRVNQEIEQLRKDLADREIQLKDTTARAREEFIALQAQQHDSAAQSSALQELWITPQGRMRRANQLLGRWLVLDTSDSALTVHIDNDRFVKGHVDLTADARERLDTAAGILLGIGMLKVTVTPTLQTSEDVRRLGLSQQRARSVMEWLASLGLKARNGVPIDTGGAVEKALGAVAGVDLMIAYDGELDAGIVPN